MGSLSESVERKDNSYTESRFSDNKQCIPNRLEDNMSGCHYSRSMEPGGEPETYQCSGAESSVVCSEIFCCESLRHLCPSPNRATLAQINKVRGPKSDQLLQETKVLWDLFMLQDHNYCRTHPRETEYRSGHSVETFYRLQQLETHEGYSASHREVVGSDRSGPVCRQVEQSK